jgi:hypothetical protein
MSDFDAAALWNALDEKRRAEGLSWAGLAQAIWNQSAVLNARRNDHPISPATIANLGRRGEVSCQHVLFMLRWLGRAPEDFLRGGAADVPAAPLPAAGPDRRVRWDLGATYAALNAARQARGLTWAELAGEVGCTPSQLTGLRTAKFAMGMRVAMRIVQWLGRPAADFVYVARW